MSAMQQGMLSPSPLLLNWTAPQTLTRSPCSSSLGCLSANLLLIWCPRQCLGKSHITLSSPCSIKLGPHLNICETSEGKLVLLPLPPAIHAEVQNGILKRQCVCQSSGMYRPALEPGRWLQTAQGRDSKELLKCLSIAASSGFTFWAELEGSCQPGESPGHWPAGWTVYCRQVWPSCQRLVDRLASQTPLLAGALCECCAPCRFCAPLQE